MRVLSGIQPSGMIHLGNYFGAIKNHIELQDKHDCFYFIANYHALTSQRDAKKLRKDTLNIAADYVALGIDFLEGTLLYAQSDIPEVAELAWILGCVTPVGLMQRAPAYKEKVANGLSANMGLFSYPILQAADILITGADLVPVGKDQLPHIEIAQDIATSFNAAFNTDLLQRPEPLLGEVPKVIGTDGQKMSKSYNNSIEIFASEAKVRKQIMSIVTDSRAKGEPGVYGDDNASRILDLFLSHEEKLSWQEAYADGVGYGDVKNAIYDKFMEMFGEARDRRAELIETDSSRQIIEHTLELSAHSVREMTEGLMSHVRDVTGIARYARC